MQSSLNLDKDFTFEFLLRIDLDIFDDNSDLFTKSRITDIWTNGTFRRGNHYYGFGFAKDSSAYFFINNTDYKHYCRAKFDNFLDLEQDRGVWQYMGVSVSEFSQFSTNVCIYRRGWSTKAQCQVLPCKMNSHSSDQYYYIGGRGFNGAIKTIQIWNYAKAINVMHESPQQGLISKGLVQSNENKGDCEGFDPDGDGVFLGYCPVCDKYTQVSGSESRCNSPCPFNFYDDFCLKKCINDLCEICLDGSPNDCQVCKQGAEKNDVDYLCTCKYSDYYLAPDGQSCKTCSSRCHGCTGPTFFQCLSCEPGFIPVTDKDLCGVTGVCCLTSCQDYSRFFYLNKTQNLCLFCGLNMYSLDGLTCVGQPSSELKSLAKNMSLLTISFTRPLAHDLDITNLEAAFTIVLTGPRAEYKLAWFIEDKEWERGEYKSTLSFQLEIESTLYGIETLKVAYNNQGAFLDKDKIPLGGANFLEAETFSYSYLSAADKETTGSANSTASQSSIVSLIATIGIQSISGGSIEAMFCLSYMMQVASFLPLINVYFPTNAAQMFKALSFVNADNQVLSDIFESYIISSDDYTDQEPFAPHFDTYSVSTKNFLGNSPDQILVIIIIVGIYPFILFAKYMFSHLGPLCKNIIEIENAFHFNGVIKALQQMFLEMFIAAFLNVYTVSPVATADYISYYSAYFFIGTALFLTIFSIVYVHCNRRWLSHKKFQHTWGALVLSGEIRTKQPYHYFYLWTFFVRRMVFGASLTILINYPRMQIWLHIGLSFFILMWHLILRPYKQSILNIFYVFNEAVLIVVGFMMFLFLDPAMAESEANMYGYLMIVIVVLAIIINWAVILPSKILEGIEALKEMIRKRDDKVRYQIEKKYLMFDSEFDQNVNEIIGQRVMNRRERLNSQVRQRSRAQTPQQEEDGIIRVEDQQQLLNDPAMEQQQDYFPIKRETQGMEVLHTLESFREAVREEDKQEEELKRARTPLMDEDMKQRKPIAEPEYLQKAAIRPMTVNAVHQDRAFSPLAAYQAPLNQLFVDPSLQYAQDQTPQEPLPRSMTAESTRKPRRFRKKKTTEIREQTPDATQHMPAIVESDESAIQNQEPMVKQDGDEQDRYGYVQDSPRINQRYDEPRQVESPDPYSNDIGIAYDDQNLKLNLQAYFDQRLNPQ